MSFLGTSCALQILTRSFVDKVFRLILNAGFHVAQHVNSLRCFVYVGLLGSLHPGCYAANSVN